MRPEKNEIEE
jgi:hypothetical protein